MMRPAPAIWFEILAAKDDALCIAEALASGGCAEFEAGPPAANSNSVRPRERFHELERRYRAWWPSVALAVPHAFPAAVLSRSLARLEAWASAAAPKIDALVKAEAELLALTRWRELLAAPGFGAAERAALAGGRRLVAALFSCARRAELRPPENLLLKPLGVVGARDALGEISKLGEISALGALSPPDASGEPCLFAIGAPPAMAQLGEQVSALGGRRIDVPDWIAAPDAAARLAQRRQQNEAIVAATRRQLAALAEQHQLAETVAAARCGCWCLDNVAAVEERRALCRVTGWTGEPAALRRALISGGVRALLRFPAAPPGLQAPLLLHNPWWARPYESFGNLLGTPGRNAADPSALVALIFPLIFGYMFGDFGQGLVLVAFGALAGERWPLAKLFIPAGLSAAFFGLVFGSVFSLPGRLQPLWLDPLEQPLPVLLLPLLGGAALLLGSLLLAGVEARWRGELAVWLRREGAPALPYPGLLLAIVMPADWRLTILLATLIASLAAGVLSAWQQRDGMLPTAVLSALASSAEKTAQLAINTISFVRVGAFAIAHAGLSAALVLLADAAGEGLGALLTLILGNVFILALEALVVSVQTTRLILFEFFTRFFLASGRAFHPAAPPAPTTMEVRHEL